MPYNHTDYKRGHYQRIMKEARDLLGGVCVVCGTSENLEFDHIDPVTKLFCVSEGWTKRRDIFLAEVDKCQLLCTKHHVEKSRSEGDFSRGLVIGSARSNAKLTEKDIPVIRALLRLGHKSAFIGTLFSVDGRSIRHVDKGTRWTHVKEEA